MCLLPVESLLQNSFIVMTSVVSSVIYYMALLYGGKISIEDIIHYVFLQSA